MKNYPAYLFGVAALIGVTACGADGPPEAEPVVATTTPVVPAAPTAAAPTDLDAPVATQPAVLTLGRTSEYGPFIADGGGRTLYLLETDPQGSSNCYDACAQAWPPFLAPAGTPRAGAEGVQPGLVGTIQRRDGSTQVTYGGHPLYYYAKDQGPGQATGQDVTDQWGEWYLVTPQGNALEDHGSGPS